ncbi:MAG: TetR/AcrR family transcriptional regulator [Lachnospiraceae bacterium]|nr:TetR/AcrR family transcriptional regulator [Lachnospiraceae bacterium]
MYESTNPSAVRSQKEITDALLKLMQRHPYDEITIKQILLESKLARKTFYRNYDSKDDVLLSLMKRTLRDYFDIVNNAKGDVLTTIFSFADQNRQFLSLLDRNELLPAALKCLNEFFSPMLARQNKELNPFATLFEGLESEYLLMLNIGAVWNVISLWVRRGMTDDPEEIKQSIRTYLERINPR